MMTITTTAVITTAAVIMAEMMEAVTPAQRAAT